MTDTTFILIESGTKSKLVNHVAKHDALQCVWTVHENDEVWRHVLQFSRGVRPSSVTNFFRLTCGVAVAHCSAIKDLNRELFAYAYIRTYVRDQQQSAAFGPGAYGDMQAQLIDAIRASLKERVVLNAMYEKECAAHALTKEYLLHMMNHVGQTLGTVRSAYSMALALDNFAVQCGTNALPCLTRAHALFDTSVPAEQMLNYDDTCTVLARLDDSARKALIQRLACPRDETLAWFLGDILHTIPEQRSRWVFSHLQT